MKYPLRCAALAAMLSFATVASAQNASFDSYLETVAVKARAQGVSDNTIRTVLSGLTPNNRVIELDRDNLASGGSVNGFPPLAPYLARHNTSDRIERGRRKYRQLGPLALRVEREYGVPAPILFAIWGHETSYGAVMGGFDLPRALATLAWEGRRRDLFESELIDTIKMVDRGVPRSRLGGWNSCHPARRCKLGAANHDAAVHVVSSFTC